jgi:tRNA1(Val) A37 N6-methylase TrmN6
VTEALTRDAFLGGRLFLWQPRMGYRAGVDPVLLAAAVTARAGQTVLDLGCGAGAAMLCLHARVPGLRLTGLERQADYADLARRNAAEAGADAEIITADLAALPTDLRQRQFDHVIANPPYFNRDAGHVAQDHGRQAGRAEDTPLALWIDTAARRLRARGYLHVIQRADRAPDLLAACITSGLGSLELLPLSARTGRAAHLILVRARKDGRAPFRLHAPFVLHAGAEHLSDAEDYRPEVSAILREAAPLPWPGTAKA